MPAIFRIAGLVAAVWLLPAPLTAQIRATARTSPEHKNAIGFGASVGSFYNKGSYFFGGGVDYGRMIKGPWSAGVGVAWDREIIKPEAGASKQINSLTLIPTVSYALNRRFSLSTGVGQGFADDDNAARRLRFTRGSLGTGIVLGISLPDLPQTERDSVTLSISWEYTFGEAQPSLSVDLGMSFGF